MPSQFSDLWGDGFEEALGPSGPVSLLEEQAEYLTQRTRGHIEGVVQQAAERGTVWASLYARVPRLQGYSHKLVTIAHPVIADPLVPYPLTVINTVVAGQKKKGARRPEQTVNDLEAFRDWLEEALSSRGIHAVINNLLRYSRQGLTQ